MIPELVQELQSDLSMKKTFNVFLALTTLFLLASFDSPVHQLISTKLKVTVLDEVGNVQEGATVTLYKNQDDYNNSENPAYPPIKTNAKGVAQFKKIEAIKYFIHVEKGKKRQFWSRHRDGSAKA